MLEIKRAIPKLTKLAVRSLALNLSPSLDSIDINTDDEYLQRIKEYEIKLELRLIQLLWQLRIDSSVKSDRYSLPFHDEVTFHSEGKGCVDSRVIFRKFIERLLEVKAYKIRFYVFVNILDEGYYGSVQYCIRYYKH